VEQVAKQPYESLCYLCPGNVRAHGERNPDYSSTYCFDNDFPALSGKDHVSDFQDGLLLALGESGICRIICYSPDHSKSFCSLNEAELLAVIRTWQQEYL
jgi:UDPglucose--hexose-1-phosphate uridylyltransferase